MSLVAGTRIGPYEILAPLGAGGMGEVFRARDRRLGRDVALKTLPPAFAEDPERLERFEREARAAGALQHPGIVTVFDVGTHEGRPYIVSELVEGETLRAALRDGPLAPRRALEIGVALADALAAAHARGIVHRDLKPENVALTREGRVKLLDFGLAKLLAPEASDGYETSARTIEGALLGTAAYMAPEQARGAAADHRADLFALGCVLHEMLTGVSPFHRGTAAETIAAILKDAAQPLPGAVRQALPGVELVLERCLEKDAARRFESAADLALTLQVAGAGGAAAPAPSGVEVAAPVREQARFRRLSYRRGPVTSARFPPDGVGVVYAARWEGDPLELFWVFAGSAESRPLGLSGSELLAISPQSELAISRERVNRGPFYESGMLARVPLGGAAPRNLLPDIQLADWSPDGQQLAVVREVDGIIQLEYPIGRVLFRTSGWISSPRVSRDGRLVAFQDHPSRGDDAGAIAVVDREGVVRRLSSGWESTRGLAWSADGREVWFTATHGGTARSLTAVSLEGVARPLIHGPGAMILHDVSPQGRVLLTHGEERIGIRGLAPGASEERDLSWLDWSLLRDLTPDGRWIAFDETGEGGGEGKALYIRGLDGSPAVRLGDGVAMGFSPDGATVLGFSVGATTELTLLPVGAGSPRAIPLPGLAVHLAGWFPDGRHAWLSANLPDEAARIFRVALDGSAIEPVTPPGWSGFGTLVSPDGGRLVAQGPDGAWAIFELATGRSTPVPGLVGGERPTHWFADGSSIAVYSRGAPPVAVTRVDLAAGARELWRHITPGDPTGLFSIAPIRVAPQVGAYAYSYGRHLNDLFVVEGA